MGPFQQPRWCQALEHRTMLLMAVLLMTLLLVVPVQVLALALLLLQPMPLPMLLEWALREVLSSGLVLLPHLRQG